MNGMNELQIEIEDRLTQHLRKIQRIDFKLSASEELDIAAQLAQIEQAAQLRRIADALDILVSK